MPRKAANIDAVIGARIKAIRIKRKMSQEELAEGLGVTFQQLQKYESGVNRISASRLHTASKILRVSIGYFVDEDTSGTLVIDADLASALKTEGADEMAKAFAQIKQAQTRKALLELLLALSRTN